LAIVIGGSLALFAWRAPKVGLGGTFEPVSRESMLLANNVLLLVAAAAVLLGTLYPLVIDALGMGKLSVGPPYFDTVFVPLMTPALFLMGIGPVARWRQASVPDLAWRLRWAFGVSVASAIVAFFALGKWTPMIGLGLALAAWVASTAVLALVTRLQENKSTSWVRRFMAQPGSFYGMVLAHFGVAVFIVGVTVVSGFQSETDVRMEPGDTASVAGYQVRLDKVEDVTGPNYQASRATLTVTENGKLVSTVTPDRRVYNVSRQSMTEVAIDRGLLRDIYIALGDPVSATAWSVRVHHKPLVNWIWLGCLLMAMGGLLAVMDRRYRKVRVQARQPASSAGNAGNAGVAPPTGVAVARTTPVHP
ncbi:MAG: cytochrome c-type biogenesis CcmF C-terminal domain-containing protein, partial [Burkholderiaceae bacterium]